MYVLFSRSWKLQKMRRAAETMCAYVSKAFVESKSSSHVQQILCDLEK